jgi:hypothetical protein
VIIDHPDSAFSVNIASPGPCQGVILKKAIKEQKHASVFNDIDAGRRTLSSRQFGLEALSRLLRC